MRFLSLAMVCVFGCTSTGTNSDCCKTNTADADALAAFALVSHQDAEVLPVAKPSREDYETACAEAVKTGKPLVVGIGCAPVVPVGFLGCHADQFLQANEAPYLVVGVPIGGELVRMQTNLPATSSVSGIKAAVKAIDGMTKAQIEGTEVRQAPRPFSSNATPDFDGNVQGSPGLDVFDPANELRVPRSPLILHTNHRIPQ